jgi:hypothetical protein
VQDLNSFLPEEAQQSKEHLELVFAQRWPALEIALKSARVATGAPWHSLFVPYPQRGYDEDLSRAAEIWLFGVTLEDTLITYKRPLTEKLANRCNIKVLLAEPQRSVLRPAVLRKVEEEEIKEIDTRYKQKRIEIKASKGALRLILRDSWRQANVKDRGTIQIKETRYPLAYGAHAFDPNTPLGVLYVKLYPYHVLKPKPMLVLHANQDHAYQYFQRELKALWDRGKAIEV